MTTTTSPSTSRSAPRTTTAGRGRTTRGQRRRSVGRHSTPLTIVMLAVLAYFLLPLFWLAVSSTKSTQDLFTTFGLWFSHAPQLLANVRETVTHDDGVFLHWLLNTVLYSVGSALVVLR
ncbi:hypothetical protein ACIBM1_40205 [Streptomyces sp. NPDC050481]|uniref:hypothetical protein n=1 Tax=Streptomyces sp. NPDC050481 TaxID=3365616 RepID=UPI0037AC1A79